MKKEERRKKKMPTQRKAKRRNGNVSLAAVEGSSVVLVDVRLSQTAVCGEKSCLIFIIRIRRNCSSYNLELSFAYVEAIWVFTANKMLDKTFFTIDIFAQKLFVPNLVTFFAPPHPKKPNK